MRTAAAVGRALLAMAAGLCAAPPGGAEEPEEFTAEALIQESAATIDALPSLEARVRFRGELLGETVQGDGVYLQKRFLQGLLSRSDLRFQVGEKTTSLQRIDDGRSVWVIRSSGGEPAVERIDRPARVPAATGDEASPLSGRSPFDPASPGLAGLLRRLAASVAFVPPQPGEMGGSPVWRLEGAWRGGPQAERSSQASGATAEELPDAAVVLPPPAPTHVLLVLGRSDRMPYRIDYLRAASGSVSDPSPRNASPILSIEVLELKRRDDLEENRFRFAPSGGDSPP